MVLPIKQSCFPKYLNIYKTKVSAAQDIIRSIIKTNITGFDGIEKLVG